MASTKGVCKATGAFNQRMVIILHRDIAKSVLGTKGPQTRVRMERERYQPRTKAVGALDEIPSVSSTLKPAKLSHDRSWNARLVCASNLRARCGAYREAGIISDLSHLRIIFRLRLRVMSQHHL